MKKIIIIAAVIITAGLASCSKDNSVKPTTVNAHITTVADKGDLGTGDGNLTSTGQ